MMTIPEAQAKVDTWIKSYGVRYFDEMTNLALLMEEVGELARVFARSFGEQSYKIDLPKEEIKERIEEEMADVFFVMLCLCNQTDIDLESALKKSLEKKTSRDKDRHKNNPKLK